MFTDLLITLQSGQKSLKNLLGSRPLKAVDIDVIFNTMIDQLRSSERQFLENLKVEKVTANTSKPYCDTCRTYHDNPCQWSA